MIGALVYLQGRSTLNRLRHRLVRLKQPKYLFGAIVGGLYFYFYFFRFLFQGGTSSSSRPSPVSAGDLTPLLEFGGAFVLLVLGLLAWIMPKDRVALTFSEAEVAFLFPAPVSRQTLIHWKLIRSQISILFTTLIFTLVTNRFGQGGLAWIHAAGWWVILSTLNLHLLGSSFAITRLLDRGLTTWNRRILVLIGVLVFCGVLVWWARQTMSLPGAADLESIKSLANYLKRVFEAGPALAILYPFRLVVRPFLAPNAAGFLAVLGPALLLMGLHYVWVVRANVSFEEASVELSRKTAERIQAFRAGTYRPGQAVARPQRAPFALKPTGPAFLAIFWKNLVSVSQTFSWRFWSAAGLVVLVALAVLLSLGEGYAEVASLVGFVAMMLLAWTLLIGSQVLRNDLRNDLPNADLLKLFPLRGWQVVLGEILAPVAVLSVMQWFLVLVGLLSLSSIPGQEPIPLAVRCVVAFSVAVLAPVFTLVVTLIPNASVLLFPAWFQSGKEAPQGIEATGQRIIMAVAQLLVLLVAAIPAVIVFLVMFFVSRWLIGPVLAVPLATLVAAVIIVAEAALGIFWLGRVFDRFDLSAES